MSVIVGPGYSFIEVFDFMTRLEGMPGKKEKRACKALKELLPSHYDKECYESQKRQMGKLRAKR